MITGTIVPVSISEFYIALIFWVAFDIARSCQVSLQGCMAAKTKHLAANDKRRKSAKPTPVCTLGTPHQLRTSYDCADYCENRKDEGRIDQRSDFKPQETWGDPVLVGHADPQQHDCDRN